MWFCFPENISHVHPKKSLYTFRKRGGLLKNLDHILSEVVLTEYFLSLMFVFLINNGRKFEVCPKSTPLSTLLTRVLDVSHCKIPLWQSINVSLKEPK